MGKLPAGLHIESGWADEERKDKTPNTLQDQAWKRATQNKKPNAGTPHDWEDYENSKKDKMDLNAYIKGQMGFGS